MRTVIKNVSKDTKLDTEELELLYSIVKELNLMSWHGRLSLAQDSKPAANERRVSDACASSPYRVDFDLFSQIFPSVLPWQCSELFTIRAFRVSNLNFRVIIFRICRIHYHFLVSGPGRHWTNKF